MNVIEYYHIVKNKDFEKRQSRDSSYISNDWSFD